MSVSIPAIDLTGLRTGNERDRRAVAAKIRAACTDTGFFTVVGHGVSANLLDRTRQAAEHFFAAPAAEKILVLRPPEKISRGWNPPTDRALANTLGAKTPPDLQEAWAMGPPTSGDGAIPGSHHARDPCLCPVPFPFRRRRLRNPGLGRPQAGFRDLCLACPLPSSSSALLARLPGRRLRRQPRRRRTPAVPAAP